MMVAEAEKSPQADSSASVVAILIRLFKEAVEYGKYYLRAQLAKASLALSKVLLLVVLGLAAGLAGLAVVATAGVLLVHGIAELLTALFGGRAWAGDLVTGALLLGLVVGGAYFGTLVATRGMRAGYRESLEALRQRQRDSFGTDVRERADATWTTQGNDHGNA